MKHIILIAALSLFLTGCFGPATLDTTSKETIKTSATNIIDGLPENEREEFRKALMYYSIGGSSGVKAMMGALMSDKASAQPETLAIINIKSIDGLTGEEILNMYRKALAEDKKIRELQQAREELERAEREAKRQQEREDRETVSQLRDEARALLSSNRFEEALEKFEAMSEIDAGIDLAKDGIKETTAAMKAFNEKVAYIDNIEITEFVAKRIDTYSDKDIPAVRISLKNNGDRSLDKVNVTVYFQNSQGSTIYEESFSPVLVSPYSFGRNKPLKAGYVFEMEDGKYFTVESKLSEWDETKTTIKIVDLEFTS